MILSMKFAILGSGSSANSYFFKGVHGSFLIDCGFSLSQWETRMSEIDESPDSVQYILLTHVHSDHTKGLTKVSCKYELPVYVEAGVPGLSLYERREFRLKKDFVVNGVRFYPFPTYHDAVNSAGFHFDLDGVRFTIITDTGILNETMFRAALKSDILLLETNYCEEKLPVCRYPEFLKQRIGGTYGHLSNQTSFRFLRDLKKHPDCRLSQVYLCHLSDESNSEETVTDCFASLADEKLKITVCPKNKLIKGVSCYD